MRILFLTQWFTPEPNFIISLAKGLKKRGHHVEVLTGFPNYPGGKVYKGYKIRFWQKEEIEGLPVVRVPLYPSHSHSRIGRILNYFSFAISAAIMGSFLTGKYDVIYVYHPPITVGIPAIWLGFIKRIPFVYHIQDMWPDSVKVSGMMNNGFALGLVDKWCNYVYKKAAKLVVISPGFKQLLCERGVQEEKIETVYNWCDDSNIFRKKKDEVAAAKLGFSGKFNIIFAGTMGKGQALDAVLDAAKMLKSECPEIQYVFVGDGVESERLKKRKEEMGLGNVIFLDRRPMSEVAEILCLGDVLLVHLKDDPLYRITIPGKTQAYMSTGKPILMGVRGNASDLVAQAGAGLSCEPGNPRSIADVSKKMFAMPKEELEKMGDNGREFYSKNLSLDVAVGKFERMFESIKR